MTPQRAAPAWIDAHGSQRFVVAVSGGADSTALAISLSEAVRAAGFDPSRTMALAHFVHGTRSPEEHEADLDSVRSLAKRCGVPLIVGRWPRGLSPARGAHASESQTADKREPASPAPGGPEQGARERRYEFLRAACRCAGASVVCTAHTLDDQAETVLMRLLAGQEGILLAGIPPHTPLTPRVSVQRPFLGVDRAAVEAYLGSREARWTYDSTNSEVRLTRNLVRRVILPALEERWPAIRGDLVRLATAMRRVRERASASTAGVAIEQDGDSVSVRADAFVSLDTDARLELLYELIRRASVLTRRDRPSHRFFAPLLGDLQAGKPVRIASRGAVIELAFDRLRVARDIVPEYESGYLRTVAPGVPFTTGDGWTITPAGEMSTSAPGGVLHLYRIVRPVVVRSPRAGDCMAEDGRPVTDVLISLGVPKAVRPRVPILIDRKGIVAIIGSAIGFEDVIRSDLSESGEDLFMVVQHA